MSRYACPHCDLPIYTRRTPTRSTPVIEAWCEECGLRWQHTPPQPNRYGLLPLPADFRPVPRPDGEKP